MKRISALVLAAVLTFAAPPAQAEIYDRQISEVGESNDNVGTGVFDALQIEFGQDTEDPGVYLFWIHTNGVIKSKTFNDGKGTWAGVLIDVDGDGEKDYQLETSNTNLVGNDGVEIDLYDVNLDENISTCNAMYWSDLAKSVKWIGFKVDANCLDTYGSFSIQGFVDYVADDGKNYDYAPLDFFEVEPGLEEEPVPVDDSELIAFQEATAAVRAAELNNEKYDAAVDLVDMLPDGDQKSALEDRLAVVSDVIDARSALEEAEDDYANYDVAKEAIDALPDGSIKTSFMSRLAVVKKRYEAALLAAQRAVANKKYASCAAMNRVLPGGIAKVANFKNKGALINYKPFVLASGYAMNAGLDKDKDGIACER